MRAGIYIRVSTQEQVDNYSLEVQQERLEAFCQSKGWTVRDVYMDGGFSGSNIDRPALKRLLGDLNQIDVVVVYKLDRLSRSQKDTLELIEEHFLKNNVEFVSLTETLDTSTPFGKAMVGILSVFAQLERETIAERMRMGQVKRAENGYRTNGGNYDPAGYKRLETGELELKENEADHIQRAFDLYEQYTSIAAVQKKLKQLGVEVWRFRRYRDILCNRLYCGYVSFAGQEYKGRHQPIISEEQFNRVQVLLSKHKGANYQKAKESLLSGLITCGCCGETYHHYKISKQDGGYRYYICKGRRFPAWYDQRCDNKNWNAQKLEQLVVGKINELITDKETGKQTRPQIDYDKQLSKIDKQIGRLIDLYTNASIDPEFLNKKMEALNNDKKDILDLKRQQEDTLSVTPDQLRQDIDILHNGDFTTRQSTVQKLIKQITVKDKAIDVEWTF